MTYVYLFRGKLYTFDFSSSLSDLALLTGSRVLAMPLLGFLGIHLYRTKKQAGRSNLPDSSLRCPLIPPEQKDEEVKEEEEEEEQTKIEVQEDYLLGRKANEEMFDEKAKRARKTASFYKHLCLTFLFVISTCGVRAHNHFYIVLVFMTKNARTQVLGRKSILVSRHWTFRTRNTIHVHRKLY